MDEMMEIASGVLFDSHGEFKQKVQLVQCEGETFQADKFANRLYCAYNQLMDFNEKEFESFFGLRDYISFLKYLRNQSHVEQMMMILLG